jgi:hypothetical protein
LKGKKRVPVAGKDVFSNFSACGNRALTLKAHLILDDARREQVVRRHHKWRVGRIDNLMMRLKLLFEKPKQVSLRGAVEGKTGLI